MSKVRIAVTVVRRRWETARVEMLVDETEDQWTTFAKAEKIADDSSQQNSWLSAWTEGDSYVDRFHSGVRVLDDEESPDGLNSEASSNYEERNS